MNCGLAFFLGAIAATIYERKGWKGLFKYFVLPLTLIAIIGAIAKILLTTSPT